MAAILAMDDSLSMRQMVSFTVKGAGCQIVEAQDGQDALNKDRSQHFDDIGWQVSQQKNHHLSSLDPAWSLPRNVMAMSAGPDQQIKHNTLEASGSRGKPVRRIIWMKVALSCYDRD